MALTGSTSALRSYSNRYIVDSIFYHYAEAHVIELCTFYITLAILSIYIF